MKITKINYRAVNNPKNNVLGFVRVTLYDKIVLTNMTLVLGKYGAFLNYPSTKGSDGKYYDLYYFLEKEDKIELTEAVKKHAGIGNDAVVAKDSTTTDDTDDDIGW